MDTHKSITEEILSRAKDFVEMEQRSCFMQVLSPEYIACNLQISLEDAKEAFRQNRTLTIAYALFKKKHYYLHEF